MIPARFAPAVARVRKIQVELVCRAALATALLIFLAATIPQVKSQQASDDEVRWSSHAYTPPLQNVIRSQTNLVLVPVIVRDENGTPIAGLQKSDFELYDNGHPVQIASFSADSRLPQTVEKSAVTRTLKEPESSAPAIAPAVPATPRYVALFFDDLSTTTAELSYARLAAEKFIRTSMVVGDKVGIYTTSTTVSVEFTDDVPKLLATLGQLVSQRKKANSWGAKCPYMYPYQAYEILEFRFEHSDALDLAMREPGCSGTVSEVVAAAEAMVGNAERLSYQTMGIISDVIKHLNQMPGQRMLMLTSSGFLTQTIQEKQDKLIDEALGANVIINSLDAKGLVADVPGMTDDWQPVGIGGKWQAVFDQMKTADREAQNDPLALLAEGTGGRFYHNSNDIEAGMKELIVAPATYMLSFSPTDVKMNGSLHSIKVKVPNAPHGSSIQSRPSYLAVNPPPADNEKKKRALDDAVLATNNSDRIQAQLTTAPASSGHALNVTVHIDPEKLPFQAQGDRQVERLIFVAALFDSQNHFLTGVQGVMDLRLKKDNMSADLAKGFDANLSLQAPPGAYRLRQVIEEVGDGRITAISRPVEMQ